MMRSIGGSNSRNVGQGFEDLAFLRRRAALQIQLPTNGFKIDHESKHLATWGSHLLILFAGLNW
jgi:predicted glycosyltransferase involved in capsule biosynthesis